MRSVEATQLDCHGAFCAPAANERVFVITSLAPPRVVIQLDGHGAERLLMTFPGFIAAITQRRVLKQSNQVNTSAANPNRTVTIERRLPPTCCQGGRLGKRP